MYDEQQRACVVVTSVTCHEQQLVARWRQWLRCFIIYYLDACKLALTPSSSAHSVLLVHLDVRWCKAATGTTALRTQAILAVQPSECSSSSCQ